MGFRTIVIFNNDLASTWGNDAELGKKIMAAMNNVGDERRSQAGHGVEVVQCCHSSHTCLAMIDHFKFKEVAWVGMHGGGGEELLLKDMADGLGYRIVRKSKKK